MLSFTGCDGFSLRRRSCSCAYRPQLPPLEATSFDAGIHRGQDMACDYSLFQDPEKFRDPESGTPSPNSTTFHDALLDESPGTRPAERSTAAAAAAAANIRSLSLPLKQLSSLGRAGTREEEQEVQKSFPKTDTPPSATHGEYHRAATIGARADGRPSPYTAASTIAKRNASSSVELSQSGVAHVEFSTQHSSSRIPSPIRQPSNLLYGTVSTEGPASLQHLEPVSIGGPQAGPAVLPRDKDNDDAEEQKGSLLISLKDWLSPHAASLGSASAGSVRMRLMEIRAYAQKLKRLKVAPPPCSITWQDFTYVQRVKYEHEVVDVPKAVVKFFKKLLCMSHHIKEPVLHKLTGFTGPSDRLLVLGPPGSGRSTFLATISQRLQQAHIGKVSGRILYRGGDATASIVRTVAYISSCDEHHAKLTVRETLDFAGYLLVPDNVVLGKAIKQTTPELAVVVGRSRTDVALELFALKLVANSLVGDAYHRGISGGELRRLSFAEMAISGAPVICVDEPVRGLDTPIAVFILQMLRVFAEQLDFSIVAGMTSATDEMYSYAASYFSSLGFFRPQNVQVADFLDLVVQDIGRTLIKPQIDPSTVPATPIQFAEAYQRSSHASSAARTIEAQLQLQGSPTHPQTPSYREKKYARPYFSQFRTVLFRQLRLSTRKLNLLTARLANYIVVGLLAGFMWFQTGLSFNGFFTRAGYLFFIATFLVNTSFTQMTILYTQRAAFYKQAHAKFFRTSAFFLAFTIEDIVWTLVTTFTYGTIAYWLVGLHHRGAQFFYFLFMLLAADLQLAALHRFLGVISPSIEVAQSIGPVLNGSMLFLSGFVLIRTAIPKPWIWAYWINPLRYVIEGWFINEFKGETVTLTPPPTPPPQVDGGVLIGTVFGMTTVTASRMWLDVAVVWIYYFFWVVLGTAGLRFMRYDYKQWRKGLVLEKDDRAAWLLERQPSEIDRLEPPPFVHEQFVPACFTFLHVSYILPQSERDAFGNKQGLQAMPVVSDISGYALPGKITGILHPSGGGASTLLDALSHRKSHGTVYGDIRINGKVVGPEYKRILGYAEQFENQLARATVHEAVEFSAHLRLPACVPETSKHAMVEVVMSIMGLIPYANRPIGQQDDVGIPAGVRRRLSIAVELVANPSILLCDEPTTALDTAAALTIMEVIKQVAVTGQRTVMCAVHQPIREIVELFDYVLIITAIGRCAYFGPVGKDACHVRAYFEPLLPDQVFPERNLADVVLELASFEEGEMVARAWERSEQYCTVLHELGTDTSHDSNAAGILIVSAELRNAPFILPPRPGYVAQVGHLTLRTLRDNWRNTYFILCRWSAVCILGFVMGTLFFRLPLSQTPSDSSGTRGRVGFWFNLAAMQVGTELLAANPIYDQKPAYFRERASGTYSLMAFNIATFLGDVPYFLVGHTLFFSLYYPLAGMNSKFGRIMGSYWINALFSWMLVCQGQLFAIIASDKAQVAIMGPPAANAVALTGGFLITQSQIPKVLVWLYWASPLHYYMEAVSSVELHGRTFRCEGPPTPFPQNCVPGIEFPTGDAVLAAYDWKFSHLGRDIAILAGFAVFLMFVAKPLALKFGNPVLR
eukprot:jgi/Chlat1/6489/Chrsp45S06061